MRYPTSLALALACGLCAAGSHGDTLVVARDDRLLVSPQGPAPASRAGALGAALPDAPWENPTHVHLPGTAATPPLFLPDGTIVVGIVVPPSVAWINPAG